MTTTLERVTEPAFSAKAFFIPPSRLLRAQEWLDRHGLSRTHCTTLCNIEGRWEMEPNRPVRKRDIQRLYGVARQTAGRLLEVLAIERGLVLERVARANGADAGFVLRRAAPGCSELPQKAPGSTGHQRGGDTCATGGVSPTDQGVSPTDQGGATHVPPTRTSIKNPLQDLEQEQDISGSRLRAAPPSVVWGQVEEEMTEAALDLFTKRQAKFGGAWELDHEDRKQLLEAARRLCCAVKRGECHESLEQRLADALDRAEAHAWGHGRALPHPAAQHFGVHLRLEAFDPVRPLSEFGSDATAHDEIYPAVGWDPDQRQWMATHEGYCGESFPLADFLIDNSEPTLTPSPAAQSVAGLSGVDLEREKRRQIASLQALLAVAQ